MNETHDEDMPVEIDFSMGTRGKFFRTGIRLNLPVYLDDEVQDRLTTLASAGQCKGRGPFRPGQRSAQEGY